MGVGLGVYGEKLVMLSPLLLPPAGCRYHKSGPYYWSFTFPIQPLFQPLLQFLLVKTSVRRCLQKLTAFVQQNLLFLKHKSN